MVIHLSGQVDDARPSAEGPPLMGLTPEEIVLELDRYVVGQARAKRAVAVALRNRYRRQSLPREVAEDIIPKNMLMIGATGVGKTEIARRLARLAGAPFLKVEASKFTEVGYVGRDVESMVRDLTEIAVNLVKEEANRDNHEKAAASVEERLLDLLVPPVRPSGPRPPEDPTGEKEEEAHRRTREKFREKLAAGKLDDRMVEIRVADKAFPAIQISSDAGVEAIDIQNFLPGLFQPRTKKRRVRVGEAREHLLAEEMERLIDMPSVAKTAIHRAETMGIIFVDELDKVAGREGGHGPDVSREGVQRDLLPIVEGTAVNTKYGLVRTDHVLFIAAGAFHVSKPSDLIPELQGRFPIRVELDALTKGDFVRILKEPKNAVVKQYQALLGADRIRLEVTDDAVEEIAQYAFLVNQSTENIGARRLHTIMEKLLEEVSFSVGPRDVTIDGKAVRAILKDIVKDQDLSRYIL
jgi:ATP-dependent HslUV protease ATP-binding subunit HslU